jgi:ribosomal protein L37AE/L43A
MSYRLVPSCPKCCKNHSYYVPSNLGDIWFCPDCKTEFDSYTKEIIAEVKTK